MLCLKDVILQYNPDTLEAVRKLRGLDKPGVMDAAIDILEEWVKQQEHFTKKDFDRRYLEHGLIIAKGSVERAKMRLDKACTLRTLMPKFYGDYNVKEDFKSFDGIVKHALIPKMSKDNVRLFMIKNTGHQYDSSVCLDYLRWAVMISEYVRMYDYADTYTLVFDHSDADLSDLITKLNIVDLRQGIHVLMEGFGMRPNGIHVISSSKVIDFFVGLFKQFLTAKIGDRIQVHKTPETLREHIPIEILPKDYGGEERSLATLHDEWTNVLSSKDFREHWREMSKARTNETYRQTDNFNEQYMGMPGTFRNLSVD